MIKKLILICATLASCSASGQKPQRILSFVVERHSSAWYQEQAKLWQAEINKSNSNAYAWYNYYRATRNMFRTEKTESLSSEAKKEALDKICTDAQKAVPESFEYNIMMYMQHPNDPDFVKYYYKAEQLGADREEIYCDAVTQAEIERKIEKRDKYSLLWLNSDMSSQGLLRYHTNLLNSLDKNAILFTHGDMDTYPLWMLQAKGLRKDVTVINTSLMLLDAYRNKLCKDLNIDANKVKLDEKEKDIAASLITQISKASDATPVYIGLTCNEDLYNNLKDNLELVGLAYQYKKGKIDALAISKRNVEDIFALEYLENSYGYDISQECVSNFNQNYLPTFIALHSHYKAKANKQKMQWYKQKIEALIDTREDKADILKSLDN
jgi:hypothetical protein